MISRAAICETEQPLGRYGMETNQAFIDLLRLLAHSDEHPDPCTSPLSDITDLGDRAVPLDVRLPVLPFLKTSQKHARFPAGKLLTRSPGSHATS